MKGSIDTGRIAVAAVALAGALAATAQPAGASDDWRPSDLAAGNFRSGAGSSFRVGWSRGWPTLSHNTQRLPLRLYRGETNAVLTVVFAAGEAPKPSFSGAWDHQRAAYSLSEGAKAALTVSRLSPAVLLESTARRLTLRGAVRPKYVAFVCAGRAVVTPAARLAGPATKDVALSEPWVLIWFGSAAPLRGWVQPTDVEGELGVSKQFLNRTPPAVDLPILLRLEHRPTAIAHTGTSDLALSFASEVGKVAVMPVMGGRVFLPAETERWAAALDDDMLAACRRWSRALRDWPLHVTESVAVDADEGALTVRQRFRWISFADDWKSPPVKAAPVPPMLALALGPGLDVTFTRGGREVAPADGRLMDTPGKAMAVEGADEYTYRLGGLGGLVRRPPRGGEVPPEARPLQRKLERHVREMVDAGRLQPLLYIYGGIGGTWFSHYYWASSAELAQALTEARPYLSADLRGKVLAYLKAEWRDAPPMRFDRRRYRAGAPRTPYEFPWQEMRQVAYALKREEARRQADFFSELYGVEAYLALTGERPDPALRSRAKKLTADLLRRQDWALLGPSRLRDVRDRHGVLYYNLQGAATYNRWLAGAIGLTRLARRFGWQDLEPLGWYLVGKLAAARVAHARYVAAMHEMGLVRGKAAADNRALLHVDPTCAVVGRGPLEMGVHQNQELPPFYDLTPEVGRLLGRAARRECRVYLDHLDRSVPLWYVSEAPKQQATEHRTCPLQHLSGNVLAQYWILGKTGRAFARYVDTTRFRGDLYYIRNLAAALDSFAGEQ